MERFHREQLRSHLCVCVGEAADTDNRSPVVSGASCCGQSEEGAQGGLQSGTCGT